MNELSFYVYENVKSNWKNNRIRTAWKQKNRTNITRIKAGNMKSSKKRIKRTWKKQKTKNKKWTRRNRNRVRKARNKNNKRRNKRGIRRIWNKNIKNENRKKIEALKQTEKITKK